MPDDIDYRVGRQQRGGQCNESLILYGFKGDIVAAFELDSNGKIITTVFTLPTGNTGMPGTQCAWNKLDNFTVAAYQEMAGDFKIA